MKGRRLSFRQALTCEQGTAARCRCRCAGTLHGAKRFGEAPSYATFAELPDDDPHRIRQPRPLFRPHPLPEFDHVPRPRSRDHRHAPPDSGASDVGAAAAAAPKS